MCHLTRIHLKSVVSVLLVLFFCTGKSLEACHDGSPLVLDLDGNGIHTTDLLEPVSFDIDGDGDLETVGWTASGSKDAFLWIDLDRNRVVTGGAELFGDATLLSDGRLAANGFEALAQYDAAEVGGNGNGSIDPEDLIWRHLRLWIDRNHDGRSSPHEIRTLPSEGVLQISLSYREIDRLDGNLNHRRFTGTFMQRVTPATDLQRPRSRQTRARTISREVQDVYFRIQHDH